MEGKRGLYAYRSEHSRVEGSTLLWSEFEGEVRFPAASEDFVRLEGFLLVVAADQPGYIVGQDALDASFDAAWDQIASKGIAALDRLDRELGLIPEESLDEKNSSATPPNPIDDSPESR